MKVTYSMELRETGSWVARARIEIPSSINSLSLFSNGCNTPAEAVRELTADIRKLGAELLNSPNEWLKTLTATGINHDTKVKEYICEL